MTATAELTASQGKTLKAVTKRPLTGAEIAAKLGHKSNRGANRNLGELVALGLITSEKKNGRTVYSKV